MELWNRFVLPCFYVFISCAGFCLLYNIRGTGALLCSIGGVFGWLVYLLCQTAGWNTALSAFLAGISISAYAEAMARVRKCPASGYLLISFFPLVPGSGVYYTVQAYFQGDTARFLSVGRETLAMAGGLAIGVLLVSSLMRMMNHFLIAKRRFL